MKKIIAILIPAVTANTSWHRAPDRFIQLFTGITGYDIMLEGSRKDITGNHYSIGNYSQIMSGIFSGSIKKCLVFFGRESCNNQK
jgi:hypothetical protein